MRPSLNGGLDLATGALLLGGIVLIAGAFVVAAALGAPTPSAAQDVTDPSLATPAPVLAGRPAVGLSSDQVATVLFVDATAGAGTAARPGDRVDVLGYFSRQTVGPESLTRMLLEDVPVLTVDRSGLGVALTLAMAQDGALLLQEAQAIGARPFVVLRSAQLRPEADGAMPRSFSDTDLAARFAGAR